MLFKTAAILIIISILLALAFCSPPSQAQLGQCQMASKHCWCKERAEAEDIRDNPERYERVPDYFGPVEKPTVCIEYVDKEQTAIGGRPCVARRVCGATSRLDEFFQLHRQQYAAGYWQ